MVQTDFVHSMNCSRVMVSSLPLGFFREYVPFEKTRMYSWVSRSTGFAADCQLPQAIDTPAPAPLYQTISPRMKYPISIIIREMWSESGM
jgi:hypothetical protein